MQILNAIMPVFLGIFLFTALFCISAYGEKYETAITVSLLPENPTSGSAFVVDGMLADSHGSSLGNKRVILEKSHDGEPNSSFESVAITYTGKDGKFQFYRGNQTPAGYLRVKFMGNDVYQGSVSNILPIHEVNNQKLDSNQDLQTGGLVLTGNPDKALAILDGQLLGMTPLVLGGIIEGPHILDIGKPGYQNQTMEVYVAHDKNTGYSYTLIPGDINLENSGIQSLTGLNVFSNTSFSSSETQPEGELLYSFSKSGVSFSYYGNESSQQGANQTEITTLYDEDPSGDEFSVTILITN